MGKHKWLGSDPNDWGLELSRGDITCVYGAWAGTIQKLGSAEVSIAVLSVAWDFHVMEH